VRDAAAKATLTFPNGTVVQLFICGLDYGTNANEIKRTLNGNLAIDTKGMFMISSRV